MNGSTGYLVTSILFLFAGILSLLSVDFDAIEWNTILPGVLFLLAASIYFYNYLKYKKQDEKN